MAVLSARLKRRVIAEYGPDASDILTALEDVPESLPLAERQDAERLQAAVVLASQGNTSEFARCRRLAQVDWRDALIAAGLENSDWPQRLDAALGPPEN